MFNIFFIAVLFQTTTNGHSFFGFERTRQQLFKQNCTEVLESFALSASFFTACSIKNARPVTICGSCLEAYIDVRNTFKTLINTTSNGTSCEVILTSQDRIELLRSGYNNILATWDNANCDKCYDWNQGIPQVANATKKIYELFNTTKKCIENYPVTNDTTAVCKACSEDYLALNDFYKTLSSDATGVNTVCMDIVDYMNTTREVWSGKLGCCKLRKTPETIFLVCTCTISTLPILFYILVRFCTTKRNIGLLIQSRFGLNRSNEPTQAGQSTD